MDHHNQIPKNRQTLYYSGLVLTVGGGILCFGSFLYPILSLSSGSMPNPALVFLPFLFGMAMGVAGQFLLRIGARGIAGSGLKLDPEEAREDLKPWSRMAGGILQDVGIPIGAENSSAAAPEPDFEEKLRKLHRLHADGILTDKEYAEQKAAVLDGMKKTPAEK